MRGTIYKKLLSKPSQKGETKRNFNQLKHKAFSVSPTQAREVRKRGTRHKGKFRLVQSTVNELYIKLCDNITRLRNHGNVPILVG